MALLSGGLDDADPQIDQISVDIPLQRVHYFGMMPNAPANETSGIRTTMTSIAVIVTSNCVVTATDTSDAAAAGVV
jgi:hypothetical protein